MLHSIRTTLLIAAFYSILPGVVAQFPYLRVLDGQSSDRITALLTTTDGAVYAGGNYSAGAMLGGSVLPLYGDDDIFLTKTDENGSHLWTITGGGSFDDRSEALVTDPDGNVYWTGSYRGAAVLGPFDLTDPTNQKVAFVARISVAGEVIWVRTFRGMGFKNIDDVVATDDRVVVVGSFSEELTLPDGSVLPTSSDGRSAFLSVLDAANGDPLLTDQVGDTGTFAARAIAAAPDGILHLVGDFRGSGQVQSQTVQTLTQNDDVFYATASVSTGLQTIQRIGGANQALATDIATDAVGNAYLSGNFFGLIGTENGLSVSSNNFQTDGFLLRIDADGTPAWLRDFGGDGADNIQALYVKNDRVIAAGSFSEDFSTSLSYDLNGAQRAGYLAKFNTETGENTSGFVTTGSGVVNVFALAPGVDAPVFGGQFTGFLQLGDLQFPAENGFAAFWWQTGENTVSTRAVIEPVGLCLFPNPATAETQIVLKNERLKSWTLYDLSGRVRATGTEPIINRRSLNSGIYTLELRTSTDRILIGRLLFQ